MKKLPCSEHYMTHSLLKNFITALHSIYKRLAKTNIEWYVTGKTNLFLHGMPLSPDFRIFRKSPSERPILGHYKGYSIGRIRSFRISPKV